MSIEQIKKELLQTLHSINKNKLSIYDLKVYAETVKLASEIQTKSYAESLAETLALGGGFAFKRSLVSLVSEQDVAYIDLIAHVLQPLTDDTGFNSDASLGHNYCVCQRYILLYFHGPPENRT